VHDAVEAAELGEGVFRQRLRARAPTEIAVGATGRDNTPPVLLEARCDRPADPAGASRDQRASVR
jgi:hypothetical protein